MESLSDADRIAGNTQVLAEVEAQIASLEQMFAGLESLGNEGIGFAARSTNSECGRDGNARGDDVERICHGLEAIEIRARRGVQAARLTSTQDKLKEQTANLSIQGENVRRAFARIVSQL
jgi:hypothetical protein